MKAERRILLDIIAMKEAHVSALRELERAWDEFASSKYFWPLILGSLKKSSEAETRLMDMLLEGSDAVFH
jgi:hypothetical protein